MATQACRLGHAPSRPLERRFSLDRFMTIFQVNVTDRPREPPVGFRRRHQRAVLMKHLMALGFMIVPVSTGYQVTRLDGTVVLIDTDLTGWTWNHAQMMVESWREVNR